MGKKKREKQERGKVATVAPSLPPYDDWCEEWYSINVLVTLLDGQEMHGFYNFDKQQWHVTQDGKTVEILHPDKVKSWREWGKGATSDD